MPNFPSRKSDAISGSQFIQLISNFKSGSPKRNDLIIEQIKQGNFPSFLRKFVPIKVQENDISITYFVSPDYMSIGSDQDYVRISCDGPTSQRIANLFNCILPTKKMVDQIHSQAKTKAQPAPMSGGATVSGKKYTGKDFIQLKMQHADSLEEHNRMIERQLARLNHKPGDLVSGIKKDVVIGNKLSNKPDRVNIYGWHMNDKPIQPESTFHEAAYYDYSHSVRLVDKSCSVNIKGSIQNMNIEEVLKNPQLHSLVSYEKLISTSYKLDNSPEPDKTDGEKSPQNSPAIPTQSIDGYSRLKGRVPSEVTQRAKELLSKNMGDKIFETINGKDYMFALEPHYHPPGFKGGPIGWHKGVSVFIKGSQQESQPQPQQVQQVETKPQNNLLNIINKYLKFS